MGVGPGLESPVLRGVAVLAPARSVLDLRQEIRPAGFQQQHADGGILRNTTRDDRTGRAGSADNEVVGGFERVRQRFLIGFDARCKLLRNQPPILICLHDQPFVHRWLDYLRHLF